MHRDQLLAIDSDFFAAGIRTGAGITSGTMKRIKEEANKKHQSDSDLAKSLSELQVIISNDDEKMQSNWVKRGENFSATFKCVTLNRT